MANTHVKMHKIQVLIVREMQTEATMRYLYIQSKSKLVVPSVGEDILQRKAHILLVGI